MRDIPCAADSAGVKFNCTAIAVSFRKKVPGNSMHSTTAVNIPLLIQAVDDALSSEELLAAVENLAAARSPDAVPKLIEALNYNNPGAAVASVEGLIQIGEPAVQPILDLLDDYNYSARAWAVRALAGIGDPRGLHFILDAALNDFAMSVRRAAAKGLGSLQWDKLVLPERIKSQQQCGEALMKITADQEWVVRYAAIAGLQAIAIAARTDLPELHQTIRTHLQELLSSEPTLAIQARVHLAVSMLSK
jgi:phycocyanobilin lyase beta subunit